MHCTAKTVIQGTTISSFDVDVLDVIADVNGSDARILVRVSGPAVAAPASPRASPARPCTARTPRGVGNVGAIAATIGQYGNDVGLVTPIEQMLGPTGRDPSAARARRRSRSLRSPARDAARDRRALAVGRRLVERAARSRGRTVLVPPPGARHVRAAAARARRVRRGHALRCDRGWRDRHGHLPRRRHRLRLRSPARGRRPSLAAARDAYVYTVVGNPLDTQRDAPTSSRRRATARDAHQRRARRRRRHRRRDAAMVPLVVTVRDQDTGKTMQQTHRGGRRGRRRRSERQRALSPLAPLAVAQAVTAAFDGAPARESGRLCLRSLRAETQTPLRFCNRYVVNGGDASAPRAALAIAADITSALQAISTAHFATLHVTAFGRRPDRPWPPGDDRRSMAPPPPHAGSTADHAARRRERGPLRTIDVTLQVPHDIAPAGSRSLRGSRLDSTAATATVSSRCCSGTSVAPRSQAPRVAEGDVHDVDAVGRYDGVNARSGCIQGACARSAIRHAHQRPRHAPGQGRRRQAAAAPRTRAHSGGSASRRRVESDQRRIPADRRGRDGALPSGSAQPVLDRQRRAAGGEPSAPRGPRRRLLDAEQLRPARRSRTSR